MTAQFRSPSGILALVLLTMAAWPAAHESHAAPSRGIVAVRVIDGDSGAPLPCRLTVISEDGKLVPLEVDKAPWIASRPGVVYTGTGETRFSLEPGLYTLYANRGLEYGLAKRDLLVASGAVELNIRLEREVDTTGYVSCDPHIHTLTFSRHGDSTIEERMATIAGEGIELAIATEHNHQIDFSLFQEQTRVRERFTPVIGNEVTTPAGHMNAFPILPGSAVPEFRSTDWAVILDSIRKTPGVKIVMLNHPSNDHRDFIPTDPRRFHPASGESREGRDWSFDAMEVVTSAAMQSDWMKPYRDWFALLNRGRRITSMGSSDTHDVNRYILGQGRTYIASRAVMPDRIDVNEACDSILRGRALVSMGLLAEAWVMERGVGEQVQTSGKPLAVRVRVQGPRWIEADRVEVYLNGELTASRSIVAPKDSVEKFNESIPLPHLVHDAWLVVIASGPGIREPYWPTPRPHLPMRASWEPRVIGSTNPIWLDGDGDGHFSSANAYARRLVSVHSNESVKLARALGSFDSATAVQVASLLAQDGIDLNAAPWTRVIDQAEPHVRHGFIAYKNLLLRRDSQ